MNEKLYELYHLSKWTRQKEYIDNLEIDDPYKWLIEINKKFNDIPSDRKDKFYYLVSVLSKDIHDLTFISSLNNIKSYIIKKNINNYSKEDLLEYILTNKIYDMDPFKGLQFDKEKIKEILKDNRVMNRELLYYYVKN